MSSLPDVDPNEPQPPLEADEKFRQMASRIFTHVVVKGGDGNPFRSIREGWFVDLAAPRLRIQVQKLIRSWKQGLIARAALTHEPAIKAEVQK